METDFEMMDFDNINKPQERDFTVEDIPTVLSIETLLSDLGGNLNAFYAANQGKHPGVVFRTALHVFYDFVFEFLRANDLEKEFVKVVTSEAVLFNSASPFRPSHRLDQGTVENETEGTEEPQKG